MLLLLILLFSNPFWLNGADPPALHELGAAGSRFHVPWAVYETEYGVYDFWRSDAVARFYGTTGIEPLVIIKCTPRIPDTSIYADTTGWGCCEREFWELWHDTTRLVKELSWLPEDTVQWKNFIHAFVERYNGDGVNDYEELVHPFRKYMLEAEFPRVWCRCMPDYISDWIRYVNLTYNAIKEKDPLAVVGMAGFAGVDIHLFYEGYFPVDSYLVRSLPERDVYATREMLSGVPEYIEANNNFHRVFDETSYDYYAIHLYGNAEYMPYRTEAMWDMFGYLPIIASEGGGPFRPRGEIYNPENDTGYLSPELVEENSAWVIRYYVGGIAAGFEALFWHVNPEYLAWGQAFGDLNLKSIDEEKKPSYWTYHGLSTMLSEYDTAYAIPSIGDIVISRVETGEGIFSFFWDILDEPSELMLSIEAGSLILEPPYIMGDSLWDTTIVDTHSEMDFIIGRRPLIIKGEWSVMAVEEIATIQNTHYLTISDFPVGKGTVIKATENGLFEVFDISGRLLQSYPQRKELNWELDLPSGVYIVKHSNEQSSISRKIEVVK